PGGHVTVQVVFDPSASGSRSGLIRVIANDDQVDPDEEVTLSGTGSSAHLTASPSPLDFGGVPVGQTSTRAVNVQNTGTGSARIPAPPASHGRFSAPPHTGNLPITVGAGDSRPIDVPFAPQNGSAQMGTLTIT